MVYFFDMNSKEYFFDRVIQEVSDGGQNPIRVLELGCGTAVYVPAMIEKYAHLEYVGVEPIQSSFKKATDILRDVPRTRVVTQLGYDAVAGLEDVSFDIVISFSVLEHVKQLDRFMALSARYVKKGGVVVHRYDLGHALYPVTLKDSFHVWLGNTIPFVLPERTFVRYVSQVEVAQYYKELLGEAPYRYTYHQMPNHKNLAKVLGLQHLAVGALDDVYAWEFAHAHEFAKIALPVREKLFPTVAVWGRKVV